MSNKEDFEEYRKILVNQLDKAQEDYDKAVLSLSGGGLGVSFAFIKDILPSGLNTAKSPSLLFLAWICWVISVAFVLASHFFSQLTFRKAIYQIDDGTIGNEHPGGAYDLATAIMNFLDGALFLAGTVLIICFAYANFEV